MRWSGGRRSTNIEDRRGRSVPRGLALGGGVGGGALILIVIALLLGKDPTELLGALVADPGTGATVSAASTPEEEARVEFVSVVLADTEDVWSELFRTQGRSYEEPRLVLFRDLAESACGLQSAAVGPFYCPGDTKVYLDLGFFDELARSLGAPGDFAQAYVIAHEVGHHVQTLLGTSEEVSRAQRGSSEAEANRLSVRLELQADFFAGVWAHHAQRARGVLERGDLEEALNAASQIGDDRLQRAGRGAVAPDSFTHGTSEQRVRWFRRGFESGDPAEGDTFGAEDL
jgi:predicted metalloprotease